MLSFALSAVCSTAVLGWPGNLFRMSLFDADQVKPPRPCSRCQEMVAWTSLFCPQCGQSMVRPLAAKPVEVDQVAPVAEEPESEPEAEVRTTGWLRRSLSLGKKVEPPTPVPAEVSDQETQVMSLFDIEEAESVQARQSSRKAHPGVRFVLKFSQGLAVTVSDQAGIIGVKPVVEGEDGFRISLVDDTDTVAPEHAEFGVENGVFWVKDLKTVNGTVVEEPGAPAIQCIPYERYSLVRGSRVGLGEVSFTLN